MNELQSFYLRNRIRIISILVGILALYALTAIYYVLNVRVTSNDECLWMAKKSIKSDTTAIYFSNVKVDGVTWEAGIRDGDQLLEINNVKLLNTSVAQTELNKVPEGDYAVYKVKKPDGQILETKVKIKKLIQFGWLTQAISALIWLLIGLLVYSAKPEGLPQRLFLAIGILSVLGLTFMFFPQFQEFAAFIQKYPLLSLFMLALVTISNAFSPFVIVYLLWRFPKPFKFSDRKFVKVSMVAIPTILTLTGIFSVTFGSAIVDIDYITFLRSNYIVIFNLIGTVGSITAWVFLIIQYFREKSKESRKPLLILMLAFTFGLLVQFYLSTIAPAISDLIFNTPEYYMPVILLILVPIFFAYAIFKYHLLDVTVVIRNTIVYGAATATVALIYFIVIYVLGQWISSAIGAENQGIVAGVFFLIFAFIFQSTKDHFQDFLTRRFYPEQFAYQKVLIKFSNDISTIVGLDRILELANETFVDALKIEKFGILLRDQKSNVLRLKRNFGFTNSECIMQTSNLPLYYNEKLLTTSYPVIEQNDFPTVFLDKADRLIEEEIHTVIPLVAKSKIVGALLFGLKYSGSKFGGKDIELLYAAANQMAISIENARLYESETEKMKMEKELELARKIQQGLLPKCIPNMRGLDICGEMIPAMQVGGDYFDLIPLSDSKIFVAVGDVSGKGLPASLYMTRLQTMIQLACNNSLSPKQILIEVNKRMYESIERNWFVTMTLALFDTKKGTMKFCRAGHMPLLTALNGTVESVKSQGIGLGLEKGEVFSKTLVEEELDLVSGQIYAFFSDGITEAMNENLNLFGEDNLIEILKGKNNFRSSDVMNEVWNRVNEFRGEAQPNDDMTMVIVKVQ